MDDSILGTRPYNYLVLNSDGSPVCALDTKEEAVKAAAGLVNETDKRIIVYAPIAIAEHGAVAALTEDGRVGMLIQND